MEEDLEKSFIAMLNAMIDVNKQIAATANEAERVELIVTYNVLARRFNKLVEMLGWNDYVKPAEEL